MTVVFFDVRQWRNDGVAAASTAKQHFFRAEVSS